MIPEKILKYWQKKKLKKKNDKLEIEKSAILMVYGDDKDSEEILTMYQTNKEKLEKAKKEYLKYN